MTVISEIRTERLFLTEVNLSDVADIFEYSRNPNVLRFTTASPPQRVEETEAFVKSLVDAPDGSYAWAIRLDQDGAVIGIIELGLHGDPAEGQRTGLHTGQHAGLHYGIAENYWGQGIVTEAAMAVVNWAFSTLNELQTITSAAMTANPASTRVQEKCGMSIERIEHTSWEKFDEPVDVAFCAITRTQWANN